MKFKEFYKERKSKIDYSALSLWWKLWFYADCKEEYKRQNKQ